MERGFFTEVRVFAEAVFFDEPRDFLDEAPDPTLPDPALGAVFLEPDDFEEEAPWGFGEEVFLRAMSVW